MPDKHQYILDTLNKRIAQLERVEHSVDTLGNQVNMLAKCIDIHQCTIEGLLKRIEQLETHVATISAHLSMTSRYEPATGAI